MRRSRWTEAVGSDGLPAQGLPRIIFRGARGGNAHMTVYMDNHATTRVDPRVVQVVTRMMVEDYGNPGSVHHALGKAAEEVVASARASLASAIGTTDREIVFTSGATESVNLALQGLAQWPRRRGNHVVSVATEHRAALDPLRRLARRVLDVTLLSPASQATDVPGWIDPQQIADAITDQTFLVSVMHVNNEMGVIQPLREIGAVCRDRGIFFHVDAAQSLGKLPIDVESLHVDLMSFSGHKLYGPKGIGALYVRRRSRDGISAVRLLPQIEGGGQEWGLRSGTVNVPGVVGFATALQLCCDELPQASMRLMTLRDRLAKGLFDRIPGMQLNGPPLDNPGLRWVGNLNVSFSDVNGEALMMNMPGLAVSSGSACTSSDPEPSHVLRAIGLPDDLARSSLRFGLGRFNDEEDVDFAIETVADAVARLRAMSG